MGLSIPKKSKKVHSVHHIMKAQSFLLGEQLVCKIIDEESKMEVNGILQVCRYLAKELEKMGTVAKSEGCRLSQLFGVMQEHYEFLQKTHRHRGEVPAFNREIQEKLLSCWFGECCSILQAYEAPSNHLLVSQLSIYIVLKLFMFTLGFDLHPIWREAVDFLENRFKDLVEFTLDKEFLETPLGPKLYSPVEYAKTYFNGYKDWFIDLLNTNGVMCQFYNKNAKGEVTDVYPDHAPITMLPRKVFSQP